MQSPQPPKRVHQPRVASQLEGSARGFLAMTQETPEPRYQEAFVDVVGARVYYLHAGCGKPMLLIHGLVGSSANWCNNIDALAQHASVYAIDLVNMGKSQRVGGLDVGLTATAN